MTCAAIMTADPLRLAEDDSVAKAADALVQHRYINLPVTDKAGRFLGMFGIYDLLSLLVPRVALAGDLLPNLRFIGDDPEALRTKFQAVKTKHVGASCDRQAVVLHPDTPVIEALRLFCQNHTTLAVVERDARKLVGIVSYWDAIRVIANEAPSA
jgi:CBS-domain-containing membrane protein